jgi:capsule polysaccharide export protein KpsE/RkpR
VSSKKFKASEANVDKLQKDNANTQSQLANTHSQLNESNAQVKNLNEEKEALKSLAIRQPQN